MPLIPGGGRKRRRVASASSDPNAYYDSLLLRSDLLAAMSLRSQQSIDENTVGGQPNTEVLYVETPVAGAQVNTPGSIVIANQVYKDFTRIRSGHLISIHDYYAYSGANSFDTHSGQTTFHKFNMLGLDQGFVSVSIASVGTTATVTDTAHGMYTGDSVLISGCTQAQYNGTFTVTVLDANTYTYTMGSDPGVSAATGSPRKGTGDERRIEQRYSNYGSTHWVVDTRPYAIGAEITGAGAGLDRITPWSTNTIPLNQWHRVVSEVNTTSGVPAYSLRIILEDTTVIVVYDEVPCTAIVALGGLDRWSPLWVNTSLSGEIVTLSASGTTVTVTHTGHEKQLGDTIKLNIDRAATDSAYNISTTVATVIDENNYTYETLTTPSGPPVAANSFFAMVSSRIHGYARNCVLLWDADSIDHSNLLEAPIP